MGPANSRWWLRGACKYEHTNGVVLQISEKQCRIQRRPAAAVQSKLHILTWSALVRSNRSGLMPTTVTQILLTELSHFPHATYQSQMVTISAPSVHFYTGKVLYHVSGRCCCIRAWVIDFRISAKFERVSRAKSSMLFQSLAAGKHG